MFSCLDPILSVAASLSFKDAFMVPLGKEEEVDKKKRELARGTRSDHLMLAKYVSVVMSSSLSDDAYLGFCCSVMIEYEYALAAGQQRDFCWEYFLSESTLRMLINMKKQFAEHLHSLKFLASKDYKSKEANRHSKNEDLVRAIICAGLYPNVASVRVKSSKRLPPQPVLATLTDRRVVVHPKSVNAKESKFRHPWMVFHVKMKSSATYVHDCSEVSPLSLIFFGERLSAGEERTPDGVYLETIAVDDFVKFNCARHTSRIFKDLRKALDDLLECKVAHPGPTDWDTSAKEGATLATIVELLTAASEGSRVEEAEEAAEEEDMLDSD
jgi:ATP-dependent RNA helicase DHX36